MHGKFTKREERWLNRASFFGVACIVLSLVVVSASTVLRQLGFAVCWANIIYSGLRLVCLWSKE